MHDYLREIYFDFCLKNDMPKHNDAYLSADDYLHGNFQLINSQVYWLKNYIRLWNILEDTWFDPNGKTVLIQELINKVIAKFVTLRTRLVGTPRGVKNAAKSYI